MKIIKKILPSLNANHRIIIIGGDGTLNEAIATFIKFQKSIPISYLPAGTGNDFSREMNFTHDIPTFLERLNNEMISALGIQASIAIDNAMNYAELLEKERISQELELASSIQKQILPKGFERIKGLDIATHFFIQS